jgi:hypothetical protein
VLASAAGRASALPANPDRNRRLAGGDLDKAAQIRLGLHSEDLGDGRRVVGEIQAIAGAHLQHLAVQAGQQRAAVLDGALGVHGRADPGVEAGEDRVSLGRWPAGHAVTSVGLVDLPLRDYPSH